MKKDDCILPSLEEQREARADIKLTRDLDENVRRIKHEFEGTETLKSRYIESQKNPGVRCCIFYTDSMTSNQIINDNIVKPINLLDMPLATSCILDVLMTKVLQINELGKTSDFNEVVEGIVYGDTVLLAQGCEEALVLNTKGWITRSLTEPEGEKVLRGPREGFTESLLVNLTMLRRRIKTRDLKFKYKVFGLQTKTRACICYVGGLAKQEILDELDRRLEKLDLDGVLDVNYLNEYIKDAPNSLFKTIGITERPDIVAAKLLEGRVAIFMDGTPTVLTVPYLFIENFQSNEDYYVSYWYATFSRMLRLVAFFMSICIPAIYVAAVTCQQELLPTPMILSISVARQGVPFPTILEALMMILVFEILKETGVRMSSNIGQALSIVGAIVIGSAAVEAKVASAPIIIVVAVTGITGLVIPRLSMAVITLRVLFLLLGSVLGLFGLVMGLMGLLIYLVDLRTFGLPSFMDPSLKFQKHKDTIMRAPWWKMKTRPEGLSDDEVRRGPAGKPEP
jgi:spore germination protein KA